MELMPVLALVGILVCAGASFCFALAEAALFSLGKWRGRQIAGQSPQDAETLALLFSSPQDLLATIVLGNTLTNAAMVALALLSTIHAAPWHTGLLLAGLLVLILIGCEVIPKTIAVRAPELWALRVGRPMMRLVRLTGPLRRVAQKLTAAVLFLVSRNAPQPRAGLSDAEYGELVEMAHQQGTLAASEKEIILQIIALDRRTAKDVMRPRARLACVSDDATPEEMLAAARHHGHSRLLIYDETPDTVVSVLNARMLLLNPGADLMDVAEFPSFVPESMNLLQLLKSLQRKRHGLAIVMDEYGGTAGVVTMADILQELVGRFHAETGAEAFVMEKLGEGRWRVSGTMRLGDFRREHPALGEVPDVETLGGLVTAQLEVVPAAGETVEFRGLRLSVTAADERRVRELIVERTGRP